MKNPIIFQNGQNKARFPGRLGKSIVEEKEVEKIVGNEDKQDNALKHQPPFSLHSSFRPNNNDYRLRGRQFVITKPGKVPLFP